MELGAPGLIERHSFIGSLTSGNLTYSYTCFLLQDTLVSNLFCFLCRFVYLIPNIHLFTTMNPQTHLIDSVSYSVKVLMYMKQNPA
jgi:hypothetical protein